VDVPALGTGAICIAKGPKLGILVGCVVDMLGGTIVVVVSRELDESASAAPSSFDGNIVLGCVYKGRVGRKVGMPLGAAVGAKLGTREGPREGAKVG
jgi:hypothetical protein